MQELKLTKNEFKELELVKLKNTIHTESDIYHMKGTDDKVLKIYDKLEDSELLVKKKNVINLIEFNKEEKIEELIMPTGLVYVDDRFVGEILPKIEGDTSTVHLYHNEVSLSDKINTLKGIGKILERIKNSNPKFNACFSDVHSDNFMVSNDKVYGIDTSSMKLLDYPGVTNFYLQQLSQEHVKKYKTNYAGIIKPNYDTDIYCYIMMILRFLSGSDLYILNTDMYKRYLDKLVNDGFDEYLINSFNSIYEKGNNISPLPYLDTLNDLDDKKLSLARKIF